MAEQSALKELGVELVKGDMTQPESYASALEGADGAFVNADCKIHFPYLAFR